jgi:hypothetical protein
MYSQLNEKFSPERIILSVFISSKSLKSRLFRSTLAAGSAALLTISPLVVRPAQALTVQSGPFTITLQSTLSWTGGYRTSTFDNAYMDEPGNANIDDGDRDFRHGPIANRFQTLEQLNIQDGSYGLRASGLAYIDTVYLGNNENNSPYTFNTYSVGPRGFPSGTVANEGRRLEPLALFVYGAEELGSSGSDRLSWQIGRQTITWGEGLFTFDTIAGLQAPADFYQAELLPNPQAQALYLPTGAAQFALTTDGGPTIDAYWKFEYEPSILPGVGSYFSPADIIGPGASQIIQGYHGDPFPNAPRGKDIRPANGFDQFGLNARENFGNSTYGFYFVRGIPTSPGVVTQLGLTGLANPPAIAKNYAIYYPDPVNAIAASYSTLLGEANVAAELSGRLNQPLASSIDTFGALPSYGNVPYAKGDVIVADVSSIYATPPLPAFPNGMVIESELTTSKIVSITENRLNLAAGTDEGAGTEIVFDPNWFPLGDLELETPVGWSETFIGHSRFDSSNAGTGTIDLGLKFTYKSNLQFGFNYQRYYGSVIRQGNLDRDFATLYVNKTF